MSTIYEAPPITPMDLEAWYKLGEVENYGHEPHPVGHLIGRVVLEDRVESAQASWENDPRVTRTELELLQLAQEYPLDYEEI